MIMNVSKVSGVVSTGVKSVAKNAKATAQNALADMYLKKSLDNMVKRWTTKEDVRNMVMWELAMKRVKGSAETIEKMVESQWQEIAKEIAIVSSLRK